MITKIFNNNLNDKEELPNNIKAKYIKMYSKIWNNLSVKEKQKYKNEYMQEYNKYLRDKEIVKKFIFRGIDGKINHKSTTYEIFLIN